MLSKSLLSSKLAVAILIVLAVFLVDLKYNQYRQQQAIEKEKQNLSQQADALEKKNKDLNESLSYLNSDSFKERVARQQLNLKKDGEVVYNFTQNPDATTSETQSPKTQSNATKWWHYFTNTN